jgi:hypothetical protein
MKTISMFVVSALILLLGFMALSPALAIDYGAQGQAQVQQTQTPDQTQTQNQTPDQTQNQTPDQTQNQTPALPNTATAPATGMSSSILFWVVIGLLAVVVVVALVAIASRGSARS